MRSQMSVASSLYYVMSREGIVVALVYRTSLPHTIINCHGFNRLWQEWFVSDFDFVGVWAVFSTPTTLISKTAHRSGSHTRNPEYGITLANSLHNL
jgi:hypothetical protein